MTRSGFILLLAAFLMLLTAACRHVQSNSFEDFATISGTSWNYGKPVEFDASTMTDSTATGTLLLSIRHTVSYPYSNIWIEVAQTDSTRKTCLRRDTFELTMSDPFGRWRGSGMGASLRLTDTLATDYTIVRGNRIFVRHVMRSDTLHGIEQIGLLLIPVER